MTAREQFLRDAQEGGYETGVLGAFGVERALLSPEAWQAVGKTRGWTGDEVIGDTIIAPKWLWNWHRFIDRLASGDTIEEALQAIH